jgi:abequosyltransferase
VDVNKVQIAISDNASSDKTREMVAEFENAYPNFVYYCWPSNQGADRNYLKAVEISSGKYCWLMGSDDFIPAGAIQSVLDLLGDDDVYLIGRTEGNFNLEKLRDRNWLNDSEQSQKFDFSVKSELIRYFDACDRLGGLFSYLSSIIVKRESWNRHPCDEKFIGTLYSHAYVLISLLVNGGNLTYVKRPLVVSRAGNDSFLTDWISRGMIDLRGYGELGNALIVDEATRRSFWGVMRREHKPLNIIKMRAMSDGRKWPEYKNYARSVFGISVLVLFAAEVLFPITRLAFLTKTKLKSLISLR